jgi:hypothetical protein
MKKEFILLLILLSFLIFLPTVFAKVEEADCFQYYKFQEGIVFDNLKVEKSVYNPGDTITVDYNLKSKMEVPIVQGSVRVQILYNDLVIGETILDEFFTAKDVNLFFNDVVRQEFSWVVPDGAKSGDYTVKTYFIVGQTFNLGGLSFLAYGPPGVPGALTSFRVENPDATSRIFFDKEKTSMNGDNYSFASFSPVFNDTDAIDVKTVLQNEGAAKTVKYSLKIYAWDDVTENAMDQYTVEKTISLDVNESKDIEYNLPALKTGTYEMKFVAESSEGNNIMKMRLSVPGAKGRFIYIGFDNFPLKQSKESTIFFCLSNSADYTTSFNGTGTLEVLDKNNVQIYKEDFGPIVVLPTPTGEKTTFVPDKTYTETTLRVSLKDENGNLMDSSSIYYDYSKFPNITAKLDINLNKNTFTKGEALTYSISYKSDVGSSLNGDLLIYLLDPNGSIVSTKSSKISGSYQGSITLPQSSGQYILSVRELSRDLKVDKTFSITEAGGVSTNYFLIIGGIVIIIAILLVFVLIRGKTR